MKKIISMFVCLVVMLSCVTITSAAGINKYERGVLNELRTKVYVRSNVYNFPVNFTNQAENFFLTIDMTKKQYDKIIPLIRSSFNLVKANKNQIIYQSGSTKTIKIMSERIKTTLLNNAIKAGKVVGLNVMYDCRNLVITRRGTNKLVFSGAPIIKVTGEDADYTFVTIGSIMALLALSGFTVLLYRKRRVHVNK